MMPAKYGAFANKMTGRAASAAAAATTNVIISLPVDQIDENPLNEQVFSMNGISSLAERMKKKGDTSPIRVCRKEDVDDLKKIRNVIEKIINVKLQDTEE